MIRLIDLSMKITWMYVTIQVILCSFLSMISEILTKS